jgi:hypothetical protein
MDETQKACAHRAIPRQKTASDHLLLWQGKARQASRPARPTSPASATRATSRAAAVAIVVDTVDCNQPHRYRDPTRALRPRASNQTAAKHSCESVQTSRQQTRECDPLNAQAHLANHPLHQHLCAYQSTRTITMSSPAPAVNRTIVEYKPVSLHRLLHLPCWSAASLTLQDRNLSCRSRSLLLASLTHSSR